MTPPGNRELFATFPWASTALGPVDQWPAEMRAVVRTALDSGFPVSTGWGPQAIQIYNDAYVPIYGDKHPHAFGRPIAETWPEIWAFLEPAVAEVMRSGQAQTFESMLLPLARHGAPEECYFDFSYSAVHDAVGRAIGVVSIAADKSAEAIARRRSTIEQLMPGADGAGALAGLSRQIRQLLEANTMDAAAAALYPEGANLPGMRTLDWQIRMDGALARGLQGRLEQAAPSGSTVAPVTVEGLATDAAWGQRAITIPIVSRSGERLASLLLVPNALVPAASHLAFCQRLSERLHAALHFAQARELEIGSVRQAMLEQETLYRFLFDNIADGAFYAATEGTPGSDEIVLAANPQACRMLGYSAGELVGCSRELLFFPDDPVLGSAVEARARDRSFVGELTMRAKDGRAVPVELSSKLVPLGSGETRSVTIVRDIGPRLARERERTDQVRFETMAQLTGGIAHDFNNLLTVILGSLDDLQSMTAGEPRAHSLTANALLAADRAAALTGQLLQYARRHQLRAQAVDLTRFVHEVRGLLGSALGEAHLLRVEASPRVSSCNLDQAQLTTALLNLVLNARHAMPAGGMVQICVDELRLEGDALRHAGHVLAEGSYVRVCVEDTGCGIPDDLMLRIFEPYFTTRGEGEGAGLGLAMVQGFARQSGGDVRISSTPGVGTRVELLFPVQPAEPAATASRRAGQAPAGEIVLLAEDNDLVRAQSAQMLTEAGFVPVVARDGHEALALLERLPRVDILVTDLVMPGGLSGTQLAREARQRRPGLAVLIITAYDPHLEGALLRKWQILPKPYTAQALMQAVLREIHR